jgi:hypothetical protein
VSDVYTDIYWADEFDIAEADLDRIARHMHDTRAAYTLTELAKRVVRGRLRYGPQRGPAALDSWAEDSSVRRWDPSAKWAMEDHVIVAVGFPKEGVTIYEPFVGEITQIEADTVTVQIDTLGESRSYRTRGSRNELQSWRQFIENLVEARRNTRDVDAQTEYVILQHGERVVSRLLAALQADERFIGLEGHWFLHELLEPLSDAQVESLFRQMRARTEPASTADLLPLVNPPPPEGGVGLFSVYSTLLDRPERFGNAGTVTRPLWVAVPPPPPSPDRAVGLYYVYDPETYEILLKPGQRLNQRLAQRLQVLGLYELVVTDADEQ